MMQAPDTAAFQKLVRQGSRFRLFLLAKLPAAWFAGLRIKECTEESCTVSVPYKWATRNPFGSTYFACLAMAAELSTGALCMQQVYRRKPAVSMLVTALEARYFKKATGLSYFTCADGAAILSAIERAIRSGEGQSVPARSIGKNEAGETVAEFTITWSFKARSAT
jgi:hypothetical protein